MLAEAETQLKVTHEEMAKLAAPKSIPDALDEIAKEHATPATYLDEARKDLEEATDFIREKHCSHCPWARICR